MNHISPYEIVEAARSLINTPYKHQGRLPGVGLDCLGVVMVVAKITGAIKPDFDFTAYTRRGNGKLQTELDKYCSELPELTEGAIVTFKLDGAPNHCGIISKGANHTFNLIHAYENAGKVREHALIPFWGDKIVKVTGFPKVDYQ